ncbi:MAG: hypothetical protein H0W72_15940 [Planctomycetes bacterium]|nr:hypothetical protein [Planctomycetota bacterium]
MVVDLVESYLVIGTLEAVGPQHVSFVDADLHDHRESNSTKEIYASETQKFGVRVNRKRLDVPRHLVVAVSRLADVVA